MVRLIWAAMALILPAWPVSAADCPNRPALTLTDTGIETRILSRTARDVTSVTRLADGNRTFGTRREGMFPILATEAGIALAYEWRDPLPRLASLTPGQTGQAGADVTIAGSYRTHAELRWTVTGATNLAIGACTYPVLVVDLAERLDGRAAPPRTIWLSPDLRLPLRILTTAGGPGAFDGLVTRVE